ncbi:MAG: hypothetical protein QM820_25445 [Minicystis sp.]
MYGIHWPSREVKVPMSRACTIAADRLESCAISLPSWMKPSRRRSR